MTSRVPVPAQMDTHWRRRSVCRSNFDPEAFFIQDEERARGPRTIEEEVVIQRFCARCPVSGNCLDWALSLNEMGIWGGTTTRERRTIRRTRSHGTCPRCKRGRGFIMRDDSAQICTSCGLSWLV